MSKFGKGLEVAGRKERKEGKGSIKNLRNVEFMFCGKRVNRLEIKDMNTPCLDRLRGL